MADRKHGHSLRSHCSGCLVYDLVDWTEERIRPDGRRDRWVAPTVGFEFLAGHYVFGNGWERLIADYNVFRGRIWILVLAANIFAPLYRRFCRSRRYSGKE